MMACSIRKESFPWPPPKFFFIENSLWLVKILINFYICLLPQFFSFLLHDTPSEKNFLIPPCLLRLIEIHPTRLHKLHHMSTLCSLQCVNRLQLSYVFAIGTRPCAASGTLDLSLLQPRSMFLAGSGCNLLFSFHEWRNTLKNSHKQLFMVLWQWIWPAVYYCGEGRFCLILNSLYKSTQPVMQGQNSSATSCLLNQ